MFYDLHTHTTASDGILTPLEIVDHALKAGLNGLAITDHDTINGLDKALKYKEQNNIPVDVIPGIEMNTDYDNEEIHILGYFVDYYNKRLVERLDEIKEARYERASKMIIKLKKLGFSLEFEEVKRIAHDDLIGRPHIAQALIQKGYVFSIKEAFTKYIGKGKPAYIPRYKFLPEEAINLIKTSGGISILAHPGLINDQKLIDNVIKMGIEGIEVFYPEHSNEQINKYLMLTTKNHLLVTGGSDFHGLESEKSRGKLGAAGIGDNYMQEIYNYKNRKTLK